MLIEDSYHQDDCLFYFVRYKDGENLMRNRVTVPRQFQGDNLYGRLARTLNNS
jgi:hypothetical protein